MKMKDTKNALLSDAHHTVLHRGAYLAFVPKVGILNDKQHLKRAQGAVRGIDTSTNQFNMFSATHEASRNQTSATAGVRSRPHSLPLARSALPDSYLAATGTKAITFMHILNKARNIVANNVALKHVLEILLFKMTVGRQSDLHR